MGDVVLLDQPPGMERHWDRDVAHPQASPSGMAASLSGPAPVFHSVQTPPVMPPPEGKPKAPPPKKREMTHDELMDWANKAIAKLKAQEEKSLAQGPTIGPEGLRAIQVAKGQPESKAAPEVRITPREPMPSRRVGMPEVAVQERQAPSVSGPPVQRPAVVASFDMDGWLEQKTNEWANKHGYEVGLIRGMTKSLPDKLKRAQDAAEEFSKPDNLEKTFGPGGGIYGNVVNSAYDKSVKAADSAGKSVDSWLQDHSQRYKIMRLEQKINAAKAQIDEAKSAKDAGEVD